MKTYELGYRAFTGGLIVVAIALSALIMWFAATGAAQIVMLLLRWSGWRGD